MRFQQQTIVLVALFVLAVAYVASAENLEPAEKFISETCKSVIKQATPRVVEMCKQAIKAKAVEAACNLLKACTLPGLLAQLLKMGGLFG